MFILTEKKRVYTLGNNSNFQLGIGNNSDKNQLTEISYLRYKRVEKIISKDYTMALDEEGELYIWGMNGLLIPHQIKIDDFKIEDIII